MSDGPGDRRIYNSSEATSSIYFWREKILTHAHQDPQLAPLQVLVHFKLLVINAALIGAGEQASLFASVLSSVVAQEHAKSIGKDL